MGALPAEAALAPVPPPLYKAREKVYPRAVSGRVRRIKWLVLGLCLGLYYTVPWIRWDRGPGVPDQAVLVDIAQARIFFFWIEIWPQEIYFLTGALILGAFALFAVSSLFGRLWCGFTCPQTVWTDLFMWVERLIQGDRVARQRLDAAPWTAEKRLKKSATHAAWLLIAAATGGVWIAYFNDAPTLLRELFTGQASASVYFFFALFTATTYVLAGWAREQVCTYMCPWPRFQAAMLDRDSLVVTYRDWRGEPRGKAHDSGAGDCVDCFACVQVCPTGIDIRDGQQLECIGCGLCADACDGIMAKLGRPKGLVAFETLANLEYSAAATRGMPPGPARDTAGMAARLPLRWKRPRTLLYAGALTLVATVMLAGFLLRPTLSLTVLRERAPLFVRLSDGGVRNAYTLKLVNKTRSEGSLTLALEAPAGLVLSVPDAIAAARGPQLARRPDGISEYRVFLTAPPGLALGESTPVTFHLLDEAGHAVTTERSVFLRPGR